MIQTCLGTELLKWNPIVFQMTFITEIEIHFSFCFQKGSYFERCEQPIDVKPGLKICANSSVWLDFRGEKSFWSPPLTFFSTKILLFHKFHYINSKNGRKGKVWTKNWASTLKLISLKKIPSTTGYFLRGKKNSFLFFFSILSF